jgi:hypothetical protein
MKKNFIQRVIQASKEEPRIALVLLAGILCVIKIIYDLLS